MCHFKPITGDLDSEPTEVSGKIPPDLPGAWLSPTAMCSCRWRFTRSFLKGLNKACPQEAPQARLHLPPAGAAALPSAMFLLQGQMSQPAHPSASFCSPARFAGPHFQAHRAGLALPWVFSLCSSHPCHPSPCRTTQGFLGAAGLTSHISIPLGEGSALCCCLAGLGRGRAVRGDIHSNFSL